MKNLPLTMAIIILGSFYVNVLPYAKSSMSNPSYLAYWVAGVGCILYGVYSFWDTNFRNYDVAVIGGAKCRMQHKEQKEALAKIYKETGLRGYEVCELYECNDYLLESSNEAGKKNIELMKKLAENGYVFTSASTEYIVGKVVPALTKEEEVKARRNSIKLVKMKN